MVYLIIVIILVLLIVTTNILQEQSESQTDIKPTHKNNKRKYI